MKKLILVTCLLQSNVIAAELIAVDSHGQGKHYWSLVFSGKPQTELKVRATGSVEDLVLFFGDRKIVEAGASCRNFLTRPEDIPHEIIKQGMVKVEEEKISNAQEGFILLRIDSMKEFSGILNGNIRVAVTALNDQEPQPASNNESYHQSSTGKTEKACSVPKNICISKEGAFSYTLDCGYLSLGIEHKRDGNTSLTPGINFGGVSVSVSGGSP